MSTEINLELSMKYSKEELIAALGLIALDEAFCNWDYNGDGHITFILMCNDTFHFACADGEEVPISEAPALLKAVQSDKYAIIRYIAAKRGYKPLGPILKQMKEYDKESGR